MVLVELVVPALGQQYDFQLDENVRVKAAVPEIVEMLSQKEHCSFGNPADEMSLYSVSRILRLAMDATVHQNGVINGEKLILI